MGKVGHTMSNARRSFSGSQRRSTKMKFPQSRNALQGLDVAAMAE